ncbi:hypothetical protein [Nocardia violaceofusca]|uniref:hypothetical protein n=1 Tax=Nocardia violaceofusca TaxID=941182 RepID=UPI0007A45358|nr:hypothetical protein [Nocardia violaceofusca]
MTGLAHVAHPPLPLVLIGHSLGAGTAVVAMASDAAAVAHISEVVPLGTPERAPAQGFSTPPVPIPVLHGVDDRRAPPAPVRAWTNDACGAVMSGYLAT